MAIKRKPFSYDQQLKRLLVQIMAAFAGFQVRSGRQRDGRHRFQDVPVIFADYSRTAATILNGSNDGTMPSLPIISVEMTGLKEAPEYRRVQQHVESYQFRERSPVTDDGTQGSSPGRRMIAERSIPVAYKMTLKVSVWASNNDQGYQICEQIMAYFNPELDIQLSNSPADWTFLTYLKFEGTMTPKRVAAELDGGAEDQYYVFEMEFSTIVQISLPMIVYEANLVEEVHVNMKHLNDTIDWDSMESLDGFVIRSDDDPEDS